MEERQFSETIRWDDSGHLESKSEGIGFEIRQSEIMSMSCDFSNYDSHLTESWIESWITRFHTISRMTRSFCYTATDFSRSHFRLGDDTYHDVRSFSDHCPALDSQDDLAD
jgi:hypothetical protein